MASRNFGLFLWLRQRTLWDRSKITCCISHVPVGSSRIWFQVRYLQCRHNSYTVGKRHCAICGNATHQGNSTGLRSSRHQQNRHQRKLTRRQRLTLNWHSLIPKICTFSSRLFEFKVDPNVDPNWQSLRRTSYTLGNANTNNTCLGSVNVNFGIWENKKLAETFHNH